MSDEEERKLRGELEQLRQRYRDLGATIERLLGTDKTDPVQLQFLKKQQLALQDRITEIENRLLPDIIA